MSAHKDRGSGRRPDDELTRRYHEANAQDMSRPGAQVRLRVQEHARAVLEAQKQATTPTPPVANREAANQPRWKISMLASIALAGLTGLLVLQFDRGTQEEKDIAFGQPGASTHAPAPASAPAQLPMPAPAPAPAPKAALERSAVPVPKPLPAAPEPAREQQESRKAVSIDAEPAAAPGVGSANRNRDASAARESGAAAPSAFPASPPATMNAAPAAAPRVMMAPAPHAAAPAPQSQKRAESLATPRALSPAQNFVDSLPSLQQAARNGNSLDIARIVLQGTPIDGADEAGRTPLMLAVINGHEAAARQLLSLGANRALTDREGLTALDHARRLGFTGIAALLEPVR